MSEPLMLSQVLTQIIDDIQGETITLQQLLERSGRESMLLICALTSLPFLFPVSIPGVSTVFGAAIVMLALALLLNRLPWLPKRILEKPLNANKLKPVLHKGVNIVRKLDRWLKPRWGTLTTAPMMRVNAGMLLFGGLLLMAPLGGIPFSNTFPAVGILLLTLGMLQRDGLFVLLGYLGNALSVLYFAILGYLAWKGGTYIFT